ncbi:hypothetical protein Tco_0110261 [Tanacetum coccineum]
MSESEPGEMALESLRPVVIPKFEMHIYTSTLTLEELSQAMKEFCIPTDLCSRLPSPDLTMNKLSNDVIRLYVEQLNHGGMRIPFSTFLFVIIKYFRVHISQLVLMGVNRVTMFEVHCRSLSISTTVSLFQRHIDIEVRDDFSISYNEGDADRLAEHVILLRKPPQALVFLFLRI